MWFSGRKDSGKGPSLEGLESVELVPPYDDSSIDARLAESANRALCLRAAVAYWCLAPERVSEFIVPRLKSPGFLCVDLHLPTNVDLLCAMQVAGAGVYLHMLHPAAGPGSALGLPPHLLHTKTLLFDFPDERAELWVGSHNWTGRAVFGLNVEASLVVRLRRDSKLYVDSLALLERIRSTCRLLDPKRAEYYKWLQGNQLEGQKVWLTDATHPVPESLSGKKLTTFGENDTEFRAIKKVDTPVVVTVKATGSATTVRLFGRVTDAGRTRNAGVDFGDRLYTTSRSGYPPPVVGPEVPPQKVLDDSLYWASLRLDGVLPEDVMITDPAMSRWVEAPEHEFEKRSKVLRKKLPLGSKAAYVMVPSDERAFAHRAGGGGEFAALPEGKLFRQVMLQEPSEK